MEETGKVLEDDDDDDEGLGTPGDTCRRTKSES